MKSPLFIPLLALTLACGFGAPGSLAVAQTVKRTEVIEIARSYAEHRWQATAANVFHGLDASKIAVETPDGAKGGDGGLWIPGQENTGMPEGGHVILFAEWTDATKTRARFFESNPYSKVIASEYDIADLTADGFQPLRYRRIQD